MITAGGEEPVDGSEVGVISMVRMGFSCVGLAAVELDAVDRPPLSRALSAELTPEQEKSIAQKKAADRARPRLRVPFMGTRADGHFIGA